MTILFKQTTGLILAIIFVVYKILEIRALSDVKQYAKILGTRLLGILIPLLIFGLYLWYNGIWADFVDYAILGISTFTNIVPYSNILHSNGVYKVLGGIIPISLIVMVVLYIVTLVNKKLRDEEWARNLRILLPYSIAAICVIYPITDGNHFAIGSVCIICTIIYLINTAILYFIEYKSKLRFVLRTFFETVSMLLVIVYMLESARDLVKYLQEIKTQDNLTHFSFIPTDETLYQRIQNVDKYILEQKEAGKNVYILDTMSAAFTIPADEYNKNYDMFNLGNFGSKGEDGIIEDLIEDKDYVVLIVKDEYKANIQLPTKVVNFVKENYRRIGSIDVFNIYEK